MSTTVIASRHGTRLFLLPAASRALDVEAVRVVLERHGQTLLEGSELASTNEIIAAQGLDPEAASRLAEDLRGIGLTVRVVNRTGLTGSQRVGNALAVQMMFGMTGLLALLGGYTGLHEGSAILGAALLALGVAAIGLALLNAIILQRHGGARLRLAGTQRAAGPLGLTDQLADLTAHLPDHLLAPILARARKLEAHARRDPDGEAARELEALLGELRDSADLDAADEARSLAEEVRRAQRAVRELKAR